MKEQIKGTTTYIIGDLVLKAGSIIILPFLTRLLTPTEFGILSTLRPLSSVFAIVVISGLYIYQAKLYTEKTDDKKFFSIIYSINIYIISFGILLMVILISPLSRRVWDIFLAEETVKIEYIFIFLFIGLLTALNNMSINYYQLKMKYTRVTLYNLLSFFSSNFIAIILIIYYDLGVLAVIIGSLTSTIILFILSYLKYAKLFNRKFNSKETLKAVRISSPMIITALLGSVINYSDRIILAGYTNYSTVAVYSLGYSAVSIVIILINSIIVSWRPYLYNQFSTYNVETEKNIKKVFLIVNKVIIFTVSASVLISKEIVYLLFPNEYEYSYMYYSIVAFGLIFQAIYHLNVLYFQFKNKNVITTYISIVSVILNIILNIVFIPIYGPIVAALSTAIVYMLNFFISQSILRNKKKSFIRRKEFIYLFLILNPIYIYLFLSDSNYTNIICKGIYVLVIFVITFKEFKYLLFKKKFRR